MKVSTRIILFILLVVFWLAELSFAGNPTAYVSLHGDMGLASAPDNHGNQNMANVYQSGFVSQFRIFIPPGSTLVSLEILEWGGQSATARFKTPPANYDGLGSHDYTLSGLLQGELFQGQVNGGRLAILSDGFSAPFLQPVQAGWLYVNCGSPAGSPTYYMVASTTVNAAAYNVWYRSINWANDVEGVIQYSQEPIVPPIPVPQPPAPIPASGKTDILWRNNTTGENTVWSVDTAGQIFTTILPPTPTKAWRIVGVADFNCDGKPDILWRRTDTGQNAIWFMDGAKQTSAVILPPMVAGWDVQWIGDFKLK